MNPSYRKVGVAGWIAAMALAPAGVAGERYTTGNGITVILEPVGEGALAECGFVAIEAMYPVGFAHEPPGLPQAAHLVEHLVCNSASASHERGGSMRAINDDGLANAETLAHFTHYDMVVPSDRLRWALGVEAERLSSLRFDAEDVAIEGPRCASELEAVESNTSRPVHKFALMAASQGWRHGATRVRLKTLDAAPVDQLAAFHRAHYVPSNLTLAIVGPVDPGEVKASIDATLGAIARGGPAPAPRAIDWAAIEPATTIEWDSTVRVVVLAWPALDDPGARLALAAWGDVFTHERMSDAAVSAVTPVLIADGRGAICGDMPFTIVAPLRDGVEPEAAITAIDAALESALERGVAGGAVHVIRALSAQIVSPAFDARMLAAQAEAYARHSGQDRARAGMMALGTAALQRGMAEMHARGRGEELTRRVSSMPPEALDVAARRALAPEQRVVRVLTPMP